MQLSSSRISQYQWLASASSYLAVGAQTAPTYLPSSCTKHGNWTEYSNDTEAGLEIVG